MHASHLKLLRDTFHHRNQPEGESISIYVAALCNTTIHFELRDLVDALIDRICGVRDIKLQRLLSLQQVINEALATETAEKSCAGDS